MAHNSSSPPLIAPYSGEAPRPLWSVMIPVFNCSQFLPHTLESVLVQDIPEEDMQIEVIDDFSTDADVEALVARCGKGRVKYYRQPKNVGSLRNFETAINRSKGRLVHLLHGDDKVRDGYYKTIAHLFEQFPEAGAAFSRFCYIRENGEFMYNLRRTEKKEGILKDWLLRIGERQQIQYAAITVRREVYEKLGGFYGPAYGEDWEMWVRIAKHYPVAYTPEVLAEYRKHQNSISGQKFTSGQNLRDLVLVMELIQQHLPLDKREKILRKSKRFYAGYGVKTANQLWSRLRNKQVVSAQIKEALRLSKSPLVLWKVIRLYFKIIVNRA